MSTFAKYQRFAVAGKSIEAKKKTPSICFEFFQILKSNEIFVHTIPFLYASLFSRITVLSGRETKASLWCSIVNEVLQEFLIIWPIWYINKIRNICLFHAYFIWVSQCRVNFYTLICIFCFISIRFFIGLSAILLSFLCSHSFL